MQTTLSTYRDLLNFLQAHPEVLEQKIQFGVPHDDLEDTHHIREAVIIDDQYRRDSKISEIDTMPESLQAYYEISADELAEWAEDFKSGTLILTPYE